jgi:hypothetical protein
MVDGFAQETAIRRTSEAFIGPNAALLAGPGFENRYVVQRWSEHMACDGTSGVGLLVLRSQWIYRGFAH